MYSAPAVIGLLWFNARNEITLPSLGERLVNGASRLHYKWPNFAREPLTPTWRCTPQPVMGHATASALGTKAIRSACDMEWREHYVSKM
jgi:hypothetical protein